MKPATIKDIKAELNRLSREELVDVCLRMAKHKKDSKELLSYLLFDAADESVFIDEIKFSISSEFETMDSHTFYLTKKGVQRIQRRLSKYLRLTPNKQTRIELQLFFCEELIRSGIRWRRSRVLVNLYARQLSAIQKNLDGIHEDLHLEYEPRLERLREA